MNDLGDIQDYYKRMMVEDLVRLISRPQDLRLEVIPILQKELLSRGLTEEAMVLTDFLVKSKESPRFKDMTVDDLKQLIMDRLDSGESIESIKIDLKDDGVNLFDIINEDIILKERASDYLTHLKHQGLDEQQIDEKLMETLSIDKEDSEMLKIQLRKSGKQNLTVGYSVLILALLLNIISLAFGGSITIGGVGLLVIGIWRILKGYDQLKE